jgi:hypothetical protein
LRHPDGCPRCRNETKSVDPSAIVRPPGPSQPAAKPPGNFACLQPKLRSISIG